MNRTSNSFNRKRSSFLAFVIIAAIAMFATAPAAMAQVPFFFDGGLRFDDDSIVCDRFTGRCFRIDDRDRFIDNNAPFGQEFSERRITSGAANPTTRISNTGDNVNLCTPVQQIVNTGNVANEQGVVLSGSEVDDVDFTGSNITIEPSETAECTQTIDQAATAV